MTPPPPPLLRPPFPPILFEQSLNRLDDTSFDRRVIFENVYATFNFDADRLENLCFDPMDYLHRASDRSDLEPHCNFLKESSSSCDYFFKGQLNELW